MSEPRDLQGNPAPDRDAPADLPRRFRFRTTTGELRYGCYFPTTDLGVGDLGGSQPGPWTQHPDFEWLDPEPEER